MEGSSQSLSAASQLPERLSSQLIDFYQTGLEMAQQHDLESLLTAITRRAAIMLGAGRGGLYLLLPDSQELELVVAYNLDPKLLHTRLKLGEGASGLAALSGQPVHVPDYQAWEHRAPIFVDQAFRRVYAVPMKTHGAVIGVINITDTEQAGSFSPVEMELVQLFADQAAIAVENARLLEALQRELEERRRVEQAEREQRLRSEALNATAAALASSLRLDEVLDTILDNLKAVVPHEAASIMLLDGDVAYIARSRGYLERGLDAYVRGWRYPIDSIPNLRKSAETGLPIAVPDTSADPDWVSFPGLEWLRSCGFAPIQIKDRLVGFLSVDSTLAGYYTPQHSQQLKAFADHAGIALENARLFEEANQRAQQLAFLNDVTRMANQATDLNNLLENLADMLPGLFKASDSYITLGPADARVWSSHRPGPADSASRALPQVDSSHPLVQTVRAAGRVIALEQRNGQEGVPGAENGRLDRAVLGIPLTADRNHLGVVLIGYQEAHVFTPEEIALAEQAAGQIALVIWKVQLLEAERRHSAQLLRANRFISGLSHVAASIERVPDVNSVLKTLGDELEALNISCLVGQRNANGAVEIRYLSVPRQRLETIAAQSGVRIQDFTVPSPLFARLAHELGSSGRYFEDLGETAAYMLGEGASPALGKVALKANVDLRIQAIGHLLLAEDQPTGLLLLWGRELQQADLPTTALFANQVAIALENSRLYSDVQRLAITDDLTGLYNRRGLFEIGEREVERALRFSRPLAGVMMDLDHFREVNNTYGHLAGDAVLAYLGEVCRSNLRSVDLGVRYGGEEFFFLLVENDLWQAARVAERLRVAIQQRPVQTGYGTVPLTVSLGVAQVGADVNSLTRLIEAADKALFRAKEDGRNRVMVA